MKKALVLTLAFALGLGFAAFAGPISGSWSSSVTFTNGTTVEVTAFGSELVVDYTVGGWVFGTHAIFDLTSFDNLFFDATGTLGAFSFKSLLDFEPETPQFVFWGNAGSVSIAGINLYGISSIYNFSSTTTPEIGVGWQVGGNGSAGDVDITANVRFNMPDKSYYIWAYGYDWFLGKMAYKSCGTWVKPYSGWQVQTNSCSAGFSGADIYVEFPFTCLDVMLNASFSCADGFDAFNIELYNFGLGLDWLSLSEIDITFSVDSKEVTTYLGLSLGDATCITPYVSLEGDGTSLTGITLNALLLEYSFNGVTFKAGEIFDNTWYSYMVPEASQYTYGFTATGGISYACIYNEAYDEYFGFEIDGDSCCGGAFAVSVFNWFDTGDSTSIFDWMETTANLEIGLGSNTTFSTGLSLDNGGLNALKLGFEFTW